MLAPLRALGFWLVAFLVTFLAWCATMVAWLLDPVTHRLADWVLRLWGHALIAGSGLTLRVEGREHLAPGTPRVLAANHASWLDTAVLGAVSPGPIRFVLKRELIRVPFIGWHAYLTGHFLIDRTDPRAGIALLERAVAYARKRRVNPVVFPEGTRTHDGRLGELKGGAVQIAMATGFDIQPVSILGTYDLMPRGASYPRRCGTILVRFGPPIPVAGAVGGPGRRNLTALLRSALNSECQAPAIHDAPAPRAPE